MDIMSLPSEGPYVGISRDQIVKKGKNRYRLLLYGAYNAFGLIGSEVYMAKNYYKAYVKMKSKSAKRKCVGKKCK
jgi:hypothetical protein